MKELKIYNRRYLGNKQKIVNFIDETLEKEGIEFNSFIDIFAGTGAVAYHFSKTKNVIVNDSLMSNYYPYLVWFTNEELNKIKVDEMIEMFNQKLVTENNYMSENFGETYFSTNDARKIGYIRESIEKEYYEKRLTERERAYLITSLLYSMDRIANTVGHYDAYRKIGKLEDKFVMLPLSIEENQGQHKIFCEDANELIKNIEGDLLYIDPPYNSRQYCDAYHLLENVALWKKPKLEGVALKMDRTEMKSKYCTKKALDSFSELVENAKVKYVVVSYNNMYEKGAGRSQAIIKDNDILSVLSKKGNVKVYEKDVQPFTTGKSVIENHKERLYICTVNDENKIDFKMLMQNNTKKIKSPLNYVGGKFKILDNLLSVFPDKINTFVDLFCGGCNVAVNVFANKIIANDNCLELVDLFNFLKKHTYVELNEKIEKTIAEYNLSYTFENGYDFYGTTSSAGVGKFNKDGYAKLKERYNSIPNSEEKNLLFLLLIIYGFNNQIRFNSKGKFNIPVGKRDYNNSVKRNLNDFLEAIKVKDIQFENKDFRTFEYENLKENDFVYIDPPYLLGCATYNESNGWTKEDELDLYDIMVKVNEKGVKFALSNVIEHKGKVNHSLSEFAIEHQFNINFIDTNYSNSNYHSKDTDFKTVEVIITNY